jgi:hypothetical protein
MLYKIFDLDNTLIDSTHRQVTLADGTLNLAHWIENNTRELILKDQLLPCVSTIREFWNNRIQGDSYQIKILICTARVLGNADYEFFEENNILYNYMLDRPKGCMMGDAELKDIQLRLFAHNRGYTWNDFCKLATIYDDSRPVLRQMRKIGIETVDAVLWNDNLRRLNR